MCIGRLYRPCLLACFATNEREQLWQHTLGTSPFSLGFSSDGRTLVSGCEGGLVQLRDAGTGNVRQELSSGGSAVKAVALSPDGRTVAWAAGRHLWFWQIDPPLELAHHHLGPSQFLSVNFHSSGRFFATANGDGKIDFWDAQTGRHRKAFDWKIGKLHDVVFDATGDRAACCSKTGQIVVWDVDE
jgi:WD40 repeat protein